MLNNSIRQYDMFVKIYVSSCSVFLTPRKLDGLERTELQRMIKSKI